MGRIFVAAVAIGAALFLYSEAAGYPRAARRLPQLLSFVVVLLAALAIVQALLGLRRRRVEGAEPLLSAPPWRHVGIGLAFVGLIAAYAGSIPIAGYLVATPLMLALPLAALRPAGWPAIGLTVVAVTGVIWAIFVWFLNLPVPLLPRA